MLYKKTLRQIIQNTMFRMSNLKKAIHEIEKLNPKPGGSYRKQQSNWKCGSDFAIRIVMKRIGIWTDGMHHRCTFLRIIKKWCKRIRILETNRLSKRCSSLLSNKKLDSAKWFIDAIQRQETLLLPWTPLCTIKKNFPRWWWNQTETNDP
jgi:RNA polymerase sigma-54 factor